MLESRLRELVSSGNRSAATRLAQEVVKKDCVENVETLSDTEVKFEGARFEATCTVNDDGTVSKTGEYTIQDGTWTLSFERTIPAQHQKTIHTCLKDDGVISGGGDEYTEESPSSGVTEMPDSSEEQEERSSPPEQDSSGSVSISDESSKKPPWWVKIRKVFSKVR